MVHTYVTVHIAVHIRSSLYTSMIHTRQKDSTSTCTHIFNVWYTVHVQPGCSIQYISICSSIDYEILNIPVEIQLPVIDPVKSQSGFCGTETVTDLNHEFRVRKARHRQIPVYIQDYVVVFPPSFSRWKTRQRERLTTLYPT